MDHRNRVRAELREAETQVRTLNRPATRAAPVDRIFARVAYGLAEALAREVQCSGLLLNTDDYDLLSDHYKIDPAATRQRGLTFQDLPVNETGGPSRVIGNDAGEAQKIVLIKTDQEWISMWC